MVIETTHRRYGPVRRREIFAAPVDNNQLRIFSPVLGRSVGKFVIGEAYSMALPLR